MHAIISSLFKLSEQLKRSYEETAAAASGGNRQIRWPHQRARRFLNTSTFGAIINK